MNYKPGYHNTQPGQKCRILTIQIAVPVDADPSDVADEMTGLLTTCIAGDESNILDWQYVPGCGPENKNFAVASDQPVEGEIFADEIGAFALRGFCTLRHLLAELGQAVLDAKADELADTEPGIRAAAQAARKMAASNDDALDRYLSNGRHTPGHWQVEADDQKAGLHPFHDWRYVTSACKNGERVTICQMMDSEHMAYDARLIAAAPAMKAMLLMTYRYLAVMAAEGIETAVMPETVMERIDDLMAYIEDPLPPWLE